jgi:hypothetical protein
MVFDGFRRSFDELLSRATRPEDRRVAAAGMRDTLVQAKVGLDDLRDALARARAHLGVEERELETVRRRKGLAEGIGDQQTVDIAARYEQMHVERADVLRKKVAAQEAEVALGERDVASMTAELKAVMSGVDPRVAGAHAAAEMNQPSGAAPNDVSAGDGVAGEIDALGRAAARAEREADAERRLDELKRRMGK